MDGAAGESLHAGLDGAALVDRVGMDRNLNVVVVGHGAGMSIAAGVVPQSSCSFSPPAPARICSLMPSGLEELPRPVKTKLREIEFVAGIISFR